MKRSLFFAALAGSLGIAGTYVGCGNSTTNNTTPTPVMEVTQTDVKGTVKAGFALNSITLPMQKTDFAIDLNGDGHPDNQLGNIIGTLATQMLDAQSGVDQSIAEGSVSVLLSVQTSDPSLKMAEPIGVTFYLGKGFNGMEAKDDAGNTIPDGGCKSCPDFSGMGMFTVDATQTPETFFGKLDGMGHFTSNNPVTTKSPITITLKVAIISGAPALPLVINGAHIQFDVTAGPGGKPALTNGQIHGSIKSKDIQNTIIPAVAMLLTQRVMANPGSSSSKQILGIFDAGGCTNPDGTMAKAKDGKIDVCEVAQNSIIMAVLSPDVQIYDANGNYAPNAKNMMKDSLSLGLQFTAVSGTLMGN